VGQVFFIVKEIGPTLTQKCLGFFKSQAQRIADLALGEDPLAIRFQNHRL
jgi:hypothetical protein